MSQNDDKSADSLGLSPEDRRRRQEEEERKVRDLANDIARRYDASRLGKLSIASAGKAEKLDDETRRKMEARLGGSFRDVRVVRGAFADRVTRRHGADAVTIGATGLILLRDTPRTNTSTPQGRALLAHELTHVRQAKQGMHFALEQGGSGAAHEQEAEHMERVVLRDEKHGAPASVATSQGRFGASRADEVVDRVIELVQEESADDRDRRGHFNR